MDQREEQSSEGNLTPHELASVAALLSLREGVYDPTSTICPPDPRLTRRQVAAWLNASVLTVKRMDRDGKLNPQKLNGCTVRHEPADVERFIE